APQRTKTQNKEHEGKTEPDAEVREGRSILMLDAGVVRDRGHGPARDECERRHAHDPANRPAAFANFTNQRALYHLDGYGLANHKLSAPASSRSSNVDGVFM